MRIILNRKSKLDLLLEGRKENAAAAIVKKINDLELIKYLSGEILRDVIESDPTPNKKYIEWAARRMVEKARNLETVDYLQKLSNFKEDPKGFPSAYTDEMLELIRGYSEEQRYAGGHLTNAEFYIRELEGAKSTLANNSLMIRRNLPKFHRLSSRGLMDKNIDKHKEIYEFEHEIYKAEKEERQREEMKKREAGAKETTDYIHDDDDVMMLRPNSEDSACYYGRGTTWCISSTESRNWYDEYSGKGVVFYFVMFKHTPQGDDLKKLALVYEPDDYENPSEAFDVADNQLDPADAVREAVNLNILAKGVKLALANQLKRMKGESRGHFFKEFFETIVMQYEATVNGEYDDEERDRGTKVPKELKMVLGALGLDDLTEDDWQIVESSDVHEFIIELADEQESTIIGLSSDHHSENPGGPSDADYDAKLAEYDFSYVYVSHEEYDETRRYWDGGFSITITDIHDDLEYADDDEVANVFRQILDDHHVYPDEIETYNGEMNIRFNPDYDEVEGLNGFESFLDRMNDVDQALQKILGENEEDTLETFKEAGLIAGLAMTTLKERFDNLELDNFEIDIEDKELSIYKRLNITVPMPPHLFRGLTVDTPTWTDAFRADIKKSPALQAFDEILKKNQSEHSDQLIEQIRDVFDRLFEMLEASLASELPGLESGKSLEIEQTGLLIPDYNVGIYRTAHDTQIGPSGLIISYFFDVRIEADEEESASETNLKLIELFLKRVDNEDMLDKIREKLETIVQNDAVKNIIPQFEEGGEGPELDPISGKVLSKAERETEEYKTQQQVAEIDRLAFSGRSAMQENKRTLKIKVKRKLLNEATPFGGYPSGLAGNLGPNLGTSIMTHSPDEHQNLGDDTSQAAKAVIHRNGKVLLIRNDRGWDLPGGHIKQAENIVSALLREIFEETGLIISERDITSMQMRHKHKSFFCAMLPNDDITLSDEHYEYGFFTLEEAMALDDLSKEFKNAIRGCLDEENSTVEYTGNIKVKIGGHGAPTRPQG